MAYFKNCQGTTFYVSTQWRFAFTLWQNRGYIVYTPCPCLLSWSLLQSLFKSSPCVYVYVCVCVCTPRCVSVCVCVCVCVCPQVCGVEGYEHGVPCLKMA